MGRPSNWFWNSRDQRWELRTVSGLMADINEGGLRINQQARLERMYGFVGSNAGLTDIAAYGGAIAIGTITGATGLNVGDKVFGVRKNTNLQAGLLTSQFYIPTTNVLNVHVGNLGTGAGSLPAGGWDVVALRTT